MDTDTPAYFARTNFRGGERIFGIRKSDRRQHMYVIGKTGTGKTVLLKNMAIQDIKNGDGIAIVDPHGEFVEDVLAAIPDERAEDVIYFNPSDPDYAVGFNVLEVPDVRYKHLIASGLMGIFTKIWANVWSSRMEYILNNCILALIDTPGTTLLSVPRLLVDADYRARVLANVTDPVVKSFWIHEYAAYNDRFRSEAIAPIQNKVGQFLSTPLIRNIVGQQKSTISIDDVMNNGKILLVNVSKGRIGEDNSALLGAMIITKLQLSAMERVKIPEYERKDFFLYVDEFQNFATKSFASILSEARKYRLNLIIAHQYTGQLVTELDTSVRDAVFGNCGTMIIFRVGAGDAELLEPEFEPEFVIQDLVNLPNYHIYVKLMCEGVTSRPFSAGTLPPIVFEKREEIIARIIENSRRNYAVPRDKVEEEIDRWSKDVDSTSTVSSQGGSFSGARRPPPRSGGGGYGGGGSGSAGYTGPGEHRPPRFAAPPGGGAGAAKKMFSAHLGKLNIEFDDAQEMQAERAARPRDPATPMPAKPQSIMRAFSPIELSKVTRPKPVSPRPESQLRPSSPRPPAGTTSSSSRPQHPVRAGQALPRSSGQSPASQKMSSGRGPVKEISLGALLKSPMRPKKEERERKEIDLSALRSALSESLKKAAPAPGASQPASGRPGPDYYAPPVPPAPEVPVDEKPKNDDDGYSYDDEDRRHR